MDAHATTAQPTSSRCSTPTTPITPTSPASSTSSSYFRSSSSSSSSSATEPQVPFQIIVTFDGKVREMLRIEREEENATASTIRRPRRTPRPRYYARQSEEKLEMDC
ncbi:hypothetical protein DDE82_002625 [Stemphylium lycopersici]|uniref:Uncharacterized protein n=1 Tax=Stemphylium lycopersici TaxID=183478 RepID=A0A364NCK1_STELY|nr:hypothetical protein TW65_03624 [Stemphylium lycopersici]RAR07962.1 hypothetical protein DDE82_002625 [Stemphylium lycopersici]RAR15045.1 hypothetical protein DDE83_001482 [Stemphylium lycopersici]